MSSTTSLSRSSTEEALSTGRILVGEGLISQEQLTIAIKQREMYAAKGVILFIDDLLASNRFVSQSDIAEALEKVNGSSKRGRSRSILPYAICERFGVLVVRSSADVLELKSCAPLTSRNIQTILDACSVPVKEINLISVDRLEILEGLKQLSSGEFSFEQIMLFMKSQEITGSLLRQAIQAALIEAIDMRASDIRLECKTDPDAWVSHRVDGVVHQTHLLDERVMSALATRLKTDCNMDASDRRRPQDGRFSISYKGGAIDFRVSTQPVDGGETMAIRVLDENSVPTLNRLFPNQPDMINMFKRISQIRVKSGGLILISGPTGSGKTTTLYSLTQLFPRDAMNVMTVENPIEFKLPFTRQVQLNSTMNQKMSEVERSMLRQDPDVLMLGEIRDQDSMKTGLHFAESGHMVLATIHANSAEETFGRTLSMIGTEGKEDALYLLSNTLRVVINQQLAPRLCTCTSPVHDPEKIKVLQARGLAAKMTVNEDTLFYEPTGCPKCKQTGYLDRVAAHETLIIPKEREVRQRLAKLLFEGMDVFSNIRSLDGVIYKSRADVFSRLVEGGIIDMDRAVSILQQEIT